MIKQVLTMMSNWKLMHVYTFAHKVDKLDRINWSSLERFAQSWVG